MVFHNLIRSFKPLSLSNLLAVLFLICATAHAEPIIPRKIYVIYGSTRGFSGWEANLLAPLKDNLPTDPNEFMREKLLNLSRKGYRVMILKDVNPVEFSEVISDPETIGVLHQSHAMLDRKTGEISPALMMDGDPIAINQALIDMLKKYNYSTSAGPNLKFFFTGACYGQQAEASMRKLLSLPDSVQFFAAGAGGVTSKDVSLDLLTSNLRTLLDRLPDIQTQLAMQLKKSAALEKYFDVYQDQTAEAQTPMDREIEELLATTPLSGFLQHKSADVRRGAFLYLAKQSVETRKSHSENIRNALNDEDPVVQKIALTSAEDLDLEQNLIDKAQAAAKKISRSFNYALYYRGHAEVENRKPVVPPINWPADPQLKKDHLIYLLRKTTSTSLPNLFTQLERVKQSDPSFAQLLKDVLPTIQGTNHLSFELAKDLAPEIFDKNFSLVLLQSQNPDAQEAALHNLRLLDAIDATLLPAILNSRLSPRRKLYFAHAVSTASPTTETLVRQALETDIDINTAKLAMDIVERFQYTSETVKLGLIKYLAARWYNANDINQRIETYLINSDLSDKSLQDALTQHRYNLSRHHPELVRQKRKTLLSPALNFISRCSKFVKR